MGSASYRFTFTATRGVDEHEKPELQLAELDLYGTDGTSILLPGSVAINPMGGVINAHQTAAKAVDRQLATKWLDGSFKNNGHMSVIELDLPSAATVASYNLWTANDVLHRDPVSWSLEMRLEDGAWAVVDEQSGVQPPIERLTPYRAAGFQVVASRVSMPGWHGPATMALLTLSPPPPVQQYLAQIVSATPGAASTSAMQQTPMVDSTLLRAQLAAASPAIVEGGGGPASALTALLVLVTLFFVLVALANVSWIWREELDRAARAALTEEQYAALAARLEQARVSLEQARVVMTQVLRGGDEEAAVGGRVAFTRVACSTAAVMPSEEGGDDAATEPDGSRDDEHEGALSPALAKQHQLDWQHDERDEHDETAVEAELDTSPWRSAEGAEKA